LTVKATVKTFVDQSTVLSPGGFHGSLVIEAITAPWVGATTF
jgi:hypothetical protein